MSARDDELARTLKDQRAFRGTRAHLDRLLDALGSGTADVWNRWRKAHPSLRPDLRGMNLAGADLSGLDLRGIRAPAAQLQSTRAWSLRLDRAELCDARLDWADLQYANLRGADLRRARLVATNLLMADARGARLGDANLSHAVLNGAQLQGAKLRGARVVGTSAWGIETDAATDQSSMILDRWVDPLEDVSSGDAVIEQTFGRVDHLEAAHLLYLVNWRDDEKTASAALARSRKRKLSMVIDALTERVVLLLGNFDSRLPHLQSVRERLLRLGYAPVVFDFARPAHRDLIETVSILASFSRFVIADLTEPRSTPLETMLIAPQLMVPFAATLRANAQPFSMYDSLRGKYEWVLAPVRYRDTSDLVRRLPKAVIEPCERMREKLRRKRDLVGAAPASRRPRHRPATVRTRR